MNISRISIDRPVALGVLMAAALVIGIFGFLNLPVNLLPDITYPMVKVYVNWRGATPEDVEENIAEVIEPKMATVDDLDYLESSSTEGLYSLNVNFDYSADRDVAYQDVTAKMGLVRKKLPRDADEPLIIKADPAQLPVMDLIVVSDRHDLVTLRSWVENDLQKRFSSVEGTAGTEISGGLLREVRVIVNPHRMQALGISSERLIQSIKDANIDLSAGRITGERKDYVVRTAGMFDHVRQIGDIIVAPDRMGRNVYLRDVAEIEDVSDVQRIITRRNGTEGVKLSIFKQAAANTINVETGIRKKLEELKGALPAGVELGIIYNQAAYIRAANAGVRDAAIIAALLVMLATWFFLSGWRNILIVFLAMPVSLLLTFFTMNLLGYSLNILSMGGLVIAITIILDNTVVVLENITRLREERASNAAERGANEVGTALTFATLTFMALFVPFLMVPGLISLLFNELIIIVAVAIGFSWLTARTVTPMLADRFYSDVELHESERSFRDRFIERLRVWYHHSLERSLTRKWRTIIVTVVFLFLGIFLARFLGSEFMPKADDGTIMVKIRMPIGSSMAETFKVVNNIEKEVRSLPDVESYFSLAGGYIWGLVTYEIANEGEVNIQLVPAGRRSPTTDQYVERYAEKIQKAAKYPGARVKMMHTKMKGIRAIGDYDVEIEIRAPKSAQIKDMALQAQAVIERLKGVQGIANLDISLDVTKPEYRIKLNRNRLADLGLTVSQVANTARMLIDGTVASYYREEGYYYPIRVVLGEEKFRGKIDLSNIPIMTVGGAPLYISSLGEVSRSQGPVRIDRLDQMRVIKVTASVPGGDVGTANAEIAKKLSGFALPAGWSLDMGGQVRMMTENFRALGLIIALALFFAFVILAIQFESVLIPFLLLIRIPLSLAGIATMLFITGTPVGVTVLIGVVILAGMELIHGVVLITFIREKQALGLNLNDAIVNAATLRLRPILMTIMVGVFGLLPLAMNWGEGTELLQPMAVAVIGGLLYSLFLTFYFMPAAYALIEEYRAASR
ncbi:MAG: efflux RND transporter permease subunit [Spirochaetota bacterium]